MRQLAQRVLRPVALPGAPGAWYRASRGSRAFPQARLLGLVECGTHTVTAAEVGPYSHSYSHSEQAMAARLLPTRLNADMLVLADRNFYGFKLWQLACATGPGWLGG